MNERETVKLNIGKNGLTSEFMKEVEIQLGKNRRVKIKVLPGGRQEGSTREIADKIKSKLKCSIIDVRGFVFIVEKQ